MSEAQRIARIRKCFELEQQIGKALQSGHSVAALRAELEAVRTGKTEPPMALAVDPRPKNDRVVVTVARKQGPGAAAFPLGGTENEVRPRRRTAISPKVVEGDLNDLAKGKLTLSGITIVKTLLQRFEPHMIAATLGAPLKVLDKVVASHLLTLAPVLDPEDGLVLVEVLEAKLLKESRANGSL